MATPTNSARRDRIMSTDAREILDSAKPSIMGASPRRGGYKQQKDSTLQTNNAATQSAKEEENPKKGCPCRSIVEQESMFMSSVAYGADRNSCQAPPVESLYKKSNFSTGGIDSAMGVGIPNDNTSMLAIAISTVMLMASEYPRIPDEYLEYTKDYLDCIKDENEQNPPNVNGILKHINYLRDNGLVRPIGEESKEAIPEAEAPRGSVGIAEGAEGGEAAEEPTEGAQRSPRVRGYRRHQERLRSSHITPVPSASYRPSNRK